MKKRILIATLFIFVISLTAIFLTACLTANHHIDVTAGKYLSYLKEGDGFLRAEVDIKSIAKAEFDYYSGKNNVFYTEVDEDISYYSINLTLVTIAGTSEEDLVFDAPVSSSNTYRFTFKEGSLYQELLVTFLIGDDERWFIFGTNKDSDGIRLSLDTGNATVMFQLELTEKYTPVIEPCDQHVDTNDDGICDFCQTVMDDDTPTTPENPDNPDNPDTPDNPQPDNPQPCISHTDTNGDGLCDNCKAVVETAPLEDPYEGMSEYQFYKNYTPATSYMDAYYRSQHGFMSGSIEEQDEDATISSNRPSSGGKLYKNTSALYSDNGNTYTVLDSEGEVAFKVYKGGAYVTLEEVAAYLYAFADIPANYVSDKSGSPSSSQWGEYLRLNHSYFSGNTSRYPYEPELPRISGCGGDLKYYEVDIGTTGTTAGNYAVKPYNTGTKITRGAARIVYARYEGSSVTDLEDRYLFYTNNHYNDFIEYLNYENGWGNIFGNITGGGSLSSESDYNPTKYIPVLYQDFSTQTAISLDREIKGECTLYQGEQSLCISLGERVFNKEKQTCFYSEITFFKKSIYTF